MQLREVRPLGNAARRASSIVADVVPEPSALPHARREAAAPPVSAGFQGHAAERWREPGASDTPPEVGEGQVLGIWLFSINFT